MNVFRVLSRPLAVAVAAIMLAFVASQGHLVGEARAQTKPLKKVKIAVGTTVINVGYPWLTLPLALDYWKAEGYDVEVLPVGASLQALQQIPQRFLRHQIVLGQHQPVGQRHLVHGGDAG